MDKWVDRDEAQSLTEHCKRISEILQTISDNKLDVKNFQNITPIHDLLSVRLYNGRQEVPIDILTKLISVGFDVNAARAYKSMCLETAIENRHYNAVRVLVQHGAKGYSDHTSICAQWRKISPIALLARDQDAPLDLFNLLATPQNLNDCDEYFYLPLHEAVEHCCVKNAQHLIKLGARVNQRDGKSGLPLSYIRINDISQCNSELFFNLLPAREHSEDILSLIGCFLIERMNTDKTDTYVFEMLHQLLQRLHFNEPINVEMWNHSYSTIMVTNDVQVAFTAQYQPCMLPVYLCSLLLVELQFDLASAPNKIVDELPANAGAEDLTYARAIDSMWTDYHQLCQPKPLQRLCILHIRSSMTSLDDDSFLSLPVPPYLRRLLT